MLLREYNTINLSIVLLHNGITSHYNLGHLESATLLEVWRHMRPMYMRLLWLASSWDMEGVLYFWLTVPPQTVTTKTTACTYRLTPTRTGGRNLTYQTDSPSASGSFYTRPAYGIFRSTHIYIYRVRPPIAQTIRIALYGNRTIRNSALIFKPGYIYIIMHIFALCGLCCALQR